MASNWQKLSLVGLGAIHSAFCLPSFAQDSQQTLIGPVLGQAIVIQGINTAGTVRVNMLANFEALVNTTANGAELIGIIWASILLISVYRCMKKSTREGKKRLALGIVILVLALATPGFINWLIATGRDTSCFT